MNISFTKHQFLLSLFVFTLISSLALGYKIQLDSILGSLCLWYLLLSWHKKLFQTVFAINLFICVIYSTIIFLYGPISIGIMASLLESNPRESLEFIQKLPWYSWVCALITLASGVWVLHSLSLERKTQNIKYKTQILLIIVILISTFLSPIRHMIKRNEPFNVATTRVVTVGFYLKSWQVLHQYYKEARQGETATPWVVQSVQPRYQNYVLVIGESMRADYTSLYGFPIDTTPFLKTSKGLVLKHYIAAAPNTQPSLLRSLYQNKNGLPVYKNNITLLV